MLSPATHTRPRLQVCASEPSFYVGTGGLNSDLNHRAELSSQPVLVLEEMVAGGSLTSQLLWDCWPRLMGWGQEQWHGLCLQWVDRQWQHQFDLEMTVWRRHPPRAC